jgi:hypothetical protein
LKVNFSGGFNIFGNKVVTCSGNQSVKSMQPRIQDTAFGSITVAGERFDHDIIITLEGSVKKRKKKLSKAVYGTSHTISLEEAEYVYQKGARGIIIGSGQYGIAGLSAEAEAFFSQNHCEVNLLATPEAIRAWNKAHGEWIALFHITC